MYVAQQCCGLSDEGIEDALNDSYAVWCATQFQCSAAGIHRKNYPSKEFKSHALLQ